MDVVFGLVAITALLLILIAAVLLWAVRSGQFDDLEGPAWRVLMDDDRARTPPGDDAGEEEPADGVTQRSKQR
jgi:cbb3-type cytochrome oxidase maturation protein